ncbi:discoidin domain-containing protein [Komagataeibacter melomenusus]
MKHHENGHGSMKVFDCFTFYDELDILDIRLNELDSVVDYFVICEADETFTGLSKEMLFLKNRERYASFAHKIIHVPVTRFPDRYNAWVRDCYQRECLLNGLKQAGATPEDFVIITDVDEIPRHTVITQNRHRQGYVQLGMDMFQYFMNMRRSRNSWKSAYAAPLRHIHALRLPGHEHDSLTYARFNLESIVEQTDIPLFTCPDAGWHFTHLGGIEQLLKKFGSYAHANDPWPVKMRNMDLLRQQITMGMSIWHMNDLAEYIPVDHTFPAYIRENYAYFHNAGYIKDIYEAFRELQTLYLKLRMQYAGATLSLTGPLPYLDNEVPLAFIEKAGITDIDPLYFTPAGDPGRNISENRRATQSSVSDWSCHLDPVLDASNVLQGRPDGRYKFHTDIQHNPWWMVDLEEISPLRTIIVYNRLLPYAPDQLVQKRAGEMKIEVSLDGETFIEMYDHTGRPPFGGVDGNPLVVTCAGGIQARFVRLSLPAGALHLDKVEIYR